MRSLVALALCVVGCGAIGCGAGGSGPANAPPNVKGPVRKPSTAIVFVVAYEALLPVGCFDAMKGAWRSGSECLSLLPVDTPVRLERDGKVVKTTGRRAPAVTSCTLTTELANFEGGAEEKPGAIAVWPASSTARFRRISFEATKKGATDLDPKQRDAFAKGMAKAGPIGAGIALVQSASADLDDDGTSEMIFSGTTAGFDPTKKQGFGALLVGFSSQPEMAVVRSSDHSVFRAEGTLDLDDDGRYELLLSERTSHPNGRRSDSFTLAHFEGASVAPLTPVESCWPPLKATGPESSDP